MDRKSLTVEGWVNFPVSSPAWQSTGEGGMVVKLVVCDDQSFDEQYGVCTGAYVHDMLAESLIGDDQRPKPLEDVTDYRIETIEREQRAREEWQAYHYPALHQKDCPDQFVSRGYLASIVMGSTGWSGAHGHTHELWQCGFDDLSKEGKQLYAQLQALYPRARMHLLTFLDT